MQRINFNNRYGLTRAVVEEYKTKTRRIATFDEVKEPNTGWLTEQPEAGRLVLCDGVRIVAKSQYKMNEILAVAQSYKSIHEAMMSGDYGDSKYDAFRCAVVAGTKGWTNKMFVRADLMPYRIKITDIKAEKLQDISDEDCIKEGIEKRGFEESMCRPKYVYGFEDENTFYGYTSPIEAFSALINKPGVGGPGIWERNPWVLVYSFKKIK